jgi:hypothetical protein
MIFARNRKAGSFRDIRCGQPRVDDPTANPRLLSENQQNPGARAPGSDAEK